MNHDGAHCMDYERGKCPASCYYAELQEDVKARPDLIGVPMTYTHYLCEPVCARKNLSAKWLDEIETALIRAEQGMKDIDLILTMRAVRDMLEDEVRKAGRRE